MLLKKKEATPFKIPKSINLVMVDPETGLPANKETKNIIYESFKPNDNLIVDLRKLYNKDIKKDDSKNNNLVFKFY